MARILLTLACLLLACSASAQTPRWQMGATTDLTASCPIVRFDNQLFANTKTGGVCVITTGSKVFAGADSGCIGSSVGGQDFCSTPDLSGVTWNFASATAMTLKTGTTAPALAGCVKLKASSACTDSGNGMESAGPMECTTAGCSLKLANPSSGKTTIIAGTTTGSPTITTPIATSTLTGVVGAANLLTQSAALTTATLYTPAAVGAYRVSFMVTLTRAATTSSTLGAGINLNYSTGDSSTALVQNVPVWVIGSTTATQDTGSTANTVGLTLIGAVTVYTNTTAMTYDVGYTSSGATTMQYSIHVRVEAL